MAAASITITDDGQGSVQIEASFGDAIEQDSFAHQLVDQLLQSILHSAPSSNMIENTTGQPDEDKPVGLYLPASMKEH